MEITLSQMENRQRKDEAKECPNEWKVSRWIKQRQQRKQKEKEQSKLMQPFLPSDPSFPPQHVLNTLYTTNEENVCNFGFTVDPTRSRWNHVRDVILQMHPRCYFNFLTQMSNHNLCLTLIPPPDTCLLLGMSKKYCIERRHVQEKISLDLLVWFASGRLAFFTTPRHQWRVLYSRTLHSFKMLTPSGRCKCWSPSYGICQKIWMTNIAHVQMIAIISI
jgi:hypothetical protein